MSTNRPPHDDVHGQHENALRPPKAALNAAERAAKIARRKNQKAGPNRIPAAKFLFLITNLPTEIIDAETACLTYRLRWQIETACKHLKSLIHLEHFQAIDERLVKTVLYAKLILALVSQTFVAQILALSPSSHNPSTR